MEEMSATSSAILRGLVGEVKPGLDLGKLITRAPQITAEGEAVDKNLFQLNIMVFGSLIDMKGDSQNRANHLLITKAERDKLVWKIDNDFGTNLETDKRYVVASASLMKKKLLEFKCSDEPWD